MIKKLFLGLLLALSFPALAAAQLTAVSGTVTDPSGIPYANATAQIQIVPSNASPSLNGTFFSGTVGPIALDANGKFGPINLPDNNVVSPAGTKWQFTITQTPGILPPVGFGTRIFSVSITITGASQDVSTTLSAAAPQLTRGGIITSFVTFSATPTFTYVAGSQETTFIMTLTGNVTSSTLSGGGTGNDAQFIICQDGVGGHTFAWPAGVLNTPTVPSGASACSAATYINCGPVGSTACPANQWQNTDITPGGSGTVTSVSSGNFSPLFNVAVATPTTTPAFSFSILNFAQHAFYGNNTGASAAPAANLIGTSDVTPNLYVAGGGTAQAQTATLSPAATALTVGLQVCWKPSNANTGAAPTLAVNGLAATAIIKMDGAALIANDLTTTQVACVLYDGASFELVNPQAELVVSSDLKTGSAPNCTVGTAGTICQNEGTAPSAQPASSTAIYPDSTAHEYLVSTNGATNFGMLVRRQPGAIRSTAKTAAVATETTCAAAAGACNVAGMYHVHFAAYQGGTACTTNTTGGITPTLTWTDGNGTAHTAVGIPLVTNSSLIALTGTMLFNQTGSGIGTVFASGDLNIDTNGTIIQDAIGFAQCSVAGTATYFYDFAITRLQ